MGRGWRGYCVEDLKYAMEVDGRRYLYKYMLCL